MHNVIFLRAKPQTFVLHVKLLDDALQGEDRPLHFCDGLFRTVVLQVFVGRSWSRVGRFFYFQQLYVSIT